MLISVILWTFPGRFLMGYLIFVINVAVNRILQMQYLRRVRYITWSSEQTEAIPNENARQRNAARSLPSTALMYLIWLLSLLLINRPRDVCFCFSLD